MKTLILSLLLVSSSAFARDIVSLDCSGRSDVLGKVTLTAKSVFGTEKEVTMKDVVMSVTDEGSTITGRKASLENDANYKPTKYKKHIRFDMTKLVETNKFGSFLPGDECRVSVMLPQDIVTTSKSRVDAPTVVNCDQNGGSMTLDCSVDTVR
ncbi:MAG: hypothetical protein ACXWSC_18995 [Bdellovibrionota bacterium]